MTEVKKRLPDKLVYDEEGFRASTPSAIAKHKAERLRSSTIADLGSGIGIQALNFALESDRVIAVENDLQRIEALRKNSELMKLDNLEIIHGDAMDPEVVDRIGEVETVHSDPSRKKAGERWSFLDLSPNPLEVIDRYGCDKMSFDLPALFPRELIPDDWEKEYLSLSGELKRLSVYLGGAKRFGRSAVALPEGQRVVENQGLSRDVSNEDEPLKWIYDLDGSLYYSDLIPEFMRAFPDLSLLHKDRQKILLTSEKMLANPFIIRSYLTVDSARNIDDARKKLVKLRAGKVVIRYSMDPSLYYEEKRSMEKWLEGTKTVYIFKFRNTFFLAERVDHPGP